MNVGNDIVVIEPGDKKGSCVRDGDGRRLLPLGAACDFRPVRRPVGIA